MAVKIDKKIKGHSVVTADEMARDTTAKAAPAPVAADAA